MKRWITWLGVGCLIPVALVLLLSVLLYLPPFQHFVLQRATAFASRATGMQIAVEKIRLSFPLDLRVTGVEVIGAPADTLFSLRSLKVRVGLLSLLKQEIHVETIELRGVSAHTGQWIPGLEIKGYLDELQLHADQISLSKERARLRNVWVRGANVTLTLRDTVASDRGTDVSHGWAVELEKIALERVTLGLQLVDDSLRMATYIDRARLDSGLVDLGAMRYSARHFSTSGSRLVYDRGYGAPAEGFDPSHIQLDSLTVAIDSILYHGREMQAHFSRLAFVERSGIALLQTEGGVRSDERAICLPSLTLRTAASRLEVEAYIPWSSLDSIPHGTLRAGLSAQIGKEDLLKISGPLPDDFCRAFPGQPLALKGRVEGNLSSLSATEVSGHLPGAFTLQASGEMLAVTDELRRSGQFRLSATAGNLDFLLGLLPAAQRDRFVLPRGIKLQVASSLGAGQYRATMQLAEGSGKLEVDARLNTRTDSYAASARVDSLEPIHFMPHDSLMWLTASFTAEGKGLDPFAASTWSRLEGRVSDIRYGATSVSDVTMEGELRQQRLTFGLTSRYPLAAMELELNASLAKEQVEALLVADVKHLDLCGLHLLTDSLATSFQLFAEATSDRREDHDIDLSLGNWELVTPAATFHPKMLTLKVRTDSDTTQVSFHTGDLGVTLTGSDCLHDLSDKLANVSDNLSLQLKRDSTINLALLRPLLPGMHLEVKAGQDNPIHNYLQNHYMKFNSINLNAYTSPHDGFHLTGGIYGLMRDTTLLDTIRATIWQDSLALVYRAEVIKHPYRKQEPFVAGVEGRIRYQYADAHLYYRDGAGKTGLSVGVEAHKLSEGTRLHFFPEEPVIAFLPFRLNKDNYITIRSEKDISADLRLSGDQNAALWIHSNAEGRGAKEVHAELNQIDLEQISRGFEAYLPPMKGMLNADFQYAPSDSAFTVVTDLNVDGLHYDNERVGDLLFNAVYLPLEGGNHQVDMHLFRDRQEVAAATALYQMGSPDRIAGAVDVMHLPLEMVNPFIPDDMAKLSGALRGNLLIGGSSARPELNGALQLDTAAVFVAAVGSSYRFADQPIAVNDNRLAFDKFPVYASGKNPFVIDGTVDFRRIEQMTADLKLYATNMQLLNVRRNDESLVYGRLDVNLNSTLKGPLNALSMRGDIQLLGTTKATYVLKDSPLTAQDRMSDMVTFISFADTVRSQMPKKPPLPLGGMDMLLTIRIDPAVQLNVDLTPDGSNHVYLEGGGDLSFQYTPQGDMILNGRYTLSGGTVKYSLPIIPLKEFTIREGSYLQWTGNPIDPTLSLTATERIRASVALDGQSPRPVNFDVGILLKQRLENLGLQFIISAPEDLAVEEQLVRMGAEEQQKQAVAMIITGMYMGSGSGTKVNMDMGSALNSFLQSEINSIAGSALKTIDITFGMDRYDANKETGESQRTDYSFSFAKRFYNDRIRVVIGGRISTGGDVNKGQAQPFIDNISLEYRLDTSGSRYVKLFYDKNYQSLLEGEITETGVGVVLRRKMLRLGELFNFKKKRGIPVKEETHNEATN